MSFISGISHLRQETDYTCVPACLRMVLDYWGVQVSEQRLAALTHTTVAGTPLNESTAITALGMEVVVERATLSDLRNNLDKGRPCIVSVMSIHFNHYALLPPVLHAVVVVGMDDENVRIFDPARESAPDAIPMASFEAAWQGGRNRMVVVSKRESE